MARYDRADVYFSGRSKGFKIKCFELSGGLRNITALVKTGQYESPLCAPGDGESYIVRVRQLRTSRAAKYKAAFSAVSILDPDNSDTVQMRVGRSR